MEDNDKKILVIDRSTLFSEGYFQGFAPADGLNYHNIIHDNYFYMPRNVVEPDPRYKQPIAYAILVNKESRHIFAYQRAGTNDYSEQRLRGKWSWGIGGHIDKVDSEEPDPIKSSLLREIEEELEIDGFDDPQILGYINDDQTEVGMVHFGLLYLIETSSKKVKPKDKEISWGGFMSYDQLEEICMLDDKNVESWSEISLEPVRRALGLGDSVEEG